MPKRPVALFIFRRDFRLDGNPAWARAARWCHEHRAALAPCFILSDRQTDAGRNPYFSPPAYSAMVAAMDALDARALGGRLARFRVRGGRPDTELLDAVARDGQHDVRAVFFNSDVTPFAAARDAAVAAWCRARGAHFGGGDPGEGYLLWPAGTVRTKSGGNVPKSFAAFHRYTEKKTLLHQPVATRRPDIVRIEPPAAAFEPTGLPRAGPVPGVPAAADVMRDLRSGAFDDYGGTRDDYQRPTTRLSVHLKFGVVGVGDVMAVARRRRIPELQRQLLWREYYYHLAHGYPRVLTAPNAHIRPDRNKVRWKPVDRAKANAWLEGRTGEPLVDQAMARLRDTGYLHNRLRMVVASYFVREMRLDWREGERLLATRLLDYDPAQNSGGWQSMDAQQPGQEITAATQLKTDALSNDTRNPAAVPADAEYRRFDVASLADLDAALERDGVAVVKGAATPEEVERYRAGVFDGLAQLTRYMERPVRQVDPASWKSLRDLGVSHSMLMNTGSVGHMPVLWDARQNAGVIEPFSVLHGGVPPKDLLVSFDGLSVHFPPEETGRGWFRKHWFHTDQASTKEGRHCVQGLLSLHDDWSQVTDALIRDHLSRHEPACVVCDAGDLVLWDSRTFHHGVEPTRGRRRPATRMAMYVCYSPRASAKPAALKRKRGQFAERRTTNHWPH
eukprot:jgi/Tetstr1/461895/TSEL_006973.t1